MQSLIRSKNNIQMQENIVEFLMLWVNDRSIRTQMILRRLQVFRDQGRGGRQKGASDHNRKTKGLELLDSF